MPSFMSWFRGVIAPGSTSGDAYQKLAGYLVLPACRHLVPLSQTAIVGRQGCAASETRALREELQLARAEIVAHGGSWMVELNDWQELMQEYRENTRELDEDELIRLTFVGELEKVRDRLAALVPELRSSVDASGQPNDHLRARAIVLDWVTTGTFDRAAATALTGSYDGEGDYCPNEVTWLMFLEPRASARARLAKLEKQLQRLKRGYRRGNDEDTDDTIHRDAAKIALLGAVVASWDHPRGAADLPKAFDTYQRTTFDPLFHDDALFAVALETQLYTPDLAPERALTRLRGYITEPIDPPTWREEDDVALQTLDAIVRVLDLGKGLTVRETTRGAITFKASPQARDPDHF